MPLVANVSAHSAGATLIPSHVDDETATTLPGPTSVKPSSPSGSALPPTRTTRNELRCVDVRRQQFDTDVAGLAGLTDVQELRALLLVADAPQLDATGEEDHKSAPDRQQEQGPGAHGLARLWPLACARATPAALGDRRHGSRSLWQSDRATTGRQPRRQQPSRHRRQSLQRWRSRQIASVAERIDLGDYAGKPVLLWFWAPT